jgi:Glycosyl hydrolases family 38 N-terminal domain.
MVLKSNWLRAHFSTLACQPKYRFMSTENSIKRKPLVSAAIISESGYPKYNAKPFERLKSNRPTLRQEFQLEQLPVKQWEVNFVQHSHTDIGYTRSQTEILAEHLRYIDYALDYCDATDNYPDDAKFRWTCEAAWAVDEFLKCRPDQQVERLIRRIKEGRIEVTAMYFNYDELPDEQSLAASLQPLKRFRALDIAPKTAMQNDVNGIAWCLNDYYHDLGSQIPQHGDPRPPRTYLFR